MRFLSTFALLTTAALLPAQDFDFKGVPADYAITFATAGSRGLKISESAEAKAFKARLEKMVTELEPTAKDSKRLQATLAAATGMDLESPDNHYAGGFSLDAAGRPTGSIIVHARHDPRKLAAHAAGKNIPTVLAGQTKGWNATLLFASLTEIKPAAGPEADPVGVFDLDDDTLVIAPAKEAARVIGLLKGNGKSFGLHASLRPQVNATGRPYMAVSVDAAKLPANPQLTDSGFLGAVFAMGENGSEQMIKVSAFFTTKEKAAPAAQQAQGMLAMAPLMLAGDPSKPQSEEDKQMKALLGELLAGIQPVEANGNLVTLTAKWDTTRLFDIIEKALALGAAKAKATPRPASK